MSPGFPIPAPLINDPGKLVHGLVLASVNNVYNLPGGVLPMTRVQPNDMKVACNILDRIMIYFSLLVSPNLSLCKLRYDLLEGSKRYEGVGGFADGGLCDWKTMAGGNGSWSHENP